MSDTCPSVFTLLVSMLSSVLMAHYSRHVADTKLLKTKLAIRVFRVSARQVGARTVSVLTIASSLEEDSGNYTCTVPGDLGLSASLEIIIQQESECYES